MLNQLSYPRIWLRFLHFRWWLALAISLAIVVYEIVEHNIRLDSLNFMLLIEIVSIGLLLPFLIGILLQLLNGYVHQRFRWLKQQETADLIQEQALEIDTWEEFAEFMANFPRHLFPVERVLFFQLVSKEIKPGLLLCSSWPTPGPIVASVGEALQAQFDQGFFLGDLQAFPLSVDGQTAVSSTRWVCQPLAVEDRIAGALILKMAAGNQLSQTDSRLLKLLTPMLSRIMVQLGQPSDYLEQQTRLVRRLHDSVGQNLSYSLLKINELKSSSENGQTDIGDDLTALNNLLLDTYQIVRGMLSELKPSAAQELTTQLYQTAVELTQDTSLEIKIQSEGTAVLLLPSVKNQILSIFRELIINIVKHAAATSIHLHLIWKPDLLVISLEDNGIGMHHNPNHSPSFGLGLILEKAAEIDAVLTFISQPNLGAKSQLVLRFSERNVNKV